MNGRIYDPVLARFLSPDPLVSNPYFSQSYNRYSYVLNNPLGMTDPSGYSPSCSDPAGCQDAGIEHLSGPGNYVITYGSLVRESKADNAVAEDAQAEVIKPPSEDVDFDALVASFGTLSAQTIAN